MEGTASQILDKRRVGTGAGLRSVFDDLGRLKSNVSSHFITLGWLHSKIAQYKMSDLHSYNNFDKLMEPQDLS